MVRPVMAQPAPRDEPVHPPTPTEGANARREAGDGGAVLSAPRAPLQVTVRGRQVLELARARLSAGSAPGRWLVGMRWVAIGGMLCTILAGRLLVPTLDIGPLLALLGLLAIGNVGWTLALRRAAPEVPGTVGAQIAVDVAALTALLWFSGGVTNPFASFLIFHIVLAGLLGSRSTAVAVTLLAIASALLLGRAPTLLPPGSGLDPLGSMISLVALGAFTGFFVLLYARRLAELREAGARAEKLAALGRQMAAMSHELNTPLGTIHLAGSELVLLGEEAGNPEITGLARTVAAEARRASDVIGLMRGYIRADARREVVELSRFVEEAARAELDRLGFRGERVLELGGPCPMPVLAPALRQILSNLLSNAVEAMGRCPHPRIAVRLSAEPEQVVLVVEDNGTGVSPAILPRLGEPFQTTREERGGMGLGLYVSSQLAGQLGATLRLESEASRGTRVTLSLPRPQAARGG